MGVYTLGLALLELLFIGVALARGQKYAPWVLVLGLLIIALWVLTVRFEIGFPYDRLGLNIYVTLIIGILCTVAGFTGVIVRLLR